ncbi:hypothetical protein SEA_BUDSKI_68 [Gordonia phage Budski]|nr:hypothetical protein SEA_BUDSKI_68 [Gordonia phage Budski]
MSDPAEDAAQRALDVMFSEGRIARSLSVVAKDGALNGARQAAEPVRELHQKWKNHAVCGNDECPCGKPEYVCSCQLVREDDMLAWDQCPTARVVYTSDELAGDS